MSLTRKKMLDNIDALSTNFLNAYEKETQSLRTMRPNQYDDDDILMINNIVVGIRINIKQAYNHPEINEQDYNNLIQIIGRSLFSLLKYSDEMKNSNIEKLINTYINDICDMGIPIVNHKSEKIHTPKRIVPLQTANTKSAVREDTHHIIDSFNKNRPTEQELRMKLMGKKEPMRKEKSPFDTLSKIPTTNHFAKFVADLQNATTLKQINECITALYQSIINELQKEAKDKSADNITDKLHTGFRSLVAKMSDDEIKTMLDKISVIYIYNYEYQNKLFNNQNGKLTPEINLMQQYLALAEAMKTILVKKLANGNSINENKIFKDQEEKFKYFNEHVRISHKDDLMNLNINKLESKKDIDNLNPFKIAVDQLMAKVTTSKSGLKKYIFGDDNSGGQVKIKGKTIDSLTGKIRKIVEMNQLPSEQKQALNEAVFEIYKQVRLDQGWRDSRLGNVLESYLNDQNYAVPHKITKRMIMGDLASYPQTATEGDSGKPPSYKR